MQKISAQVVLINEEGKILCVSRKDNHSDFGLPGGKADPEDNGDPILTAIRETKEETGLDVHDLKLIFAIHKYGYMNYTFVAKYSGEINFDEPHIVKWAPIKLATEGTFGVYNQLVAESLRDSNYEFIRHF
jgi:8-oxo-dGTP pyrophosphatase MutT (NUDIX family)